MLANCAASTLGRSSRRRPPLPSLAKRVKQKRLPHVSSAFFQTQITRKHLMLRLWHHLPANRRVAITIWLWRGVLHSQQRVKHQWGPLILIIIEQYLACRSMSPSVSQSVRVLCEIINKKAYACDPIIEECSSKSSMPLRPSITGIVKLLDLTIAPDNTSVEIP